MIPFTENRDRDQGGFVTEKGLNLLELHPANPFIYDMLVRPVKYREKKEYHSHYGVPMVRGKCQMQAEVQTEMKLTSITESNIQIEKIVDSMSV